MSARVKQANDRKIYGVKVRAGDTSSLQQVPGDARHAGMPCIIGNLKV